MLTAEDEKQIAQRGAQKNIILKQIEDFKAGFPFLEVERSAAVSDGIIQADAAKFAEIFEAEAPQLHICKFVPASGAATRMFKALFEYLAEPVSPKPTAITQFFERLSDFAFYDDLKTLLTDHSEKEILETLLHDKGLQYGSLPKGLLKFHKYAESTKTPVEEQATDGSLYACGREGVWLHFTVSAEHRAWFENLAKTLISKAAVPMKIDFSEQKKSTDTVAVDLDNQPFRDAAGQLMFRPAGHGALLANLNEIDADLIFVKNIDNVVPDHLKPEMVQYKKVLAGLLLSIQKVFFETAQAIEAGGGFDREPIKGIFEQYFKIDIDSFETDAQLFDFLNKPLRVCGMVKNVGEPGGGPFWVKNKAGQSSLQIVESAQIDMNSEQQKSIFQKSTHFNPVDLVCSVRNFKGEKFDLHKFTDPSTGFITEKSAGGKKLKAMELPGLWNGSMALWHTLFVEVPLSTFNPVKTVNDLLRPEHQVL